MSTLPSVVFVLGGPGSGKGTQCQRLVQEFALVHLSAGDLLRAERNSGSKNGDLINKHITEGSIVPVDITIALIKNAIDKHCIANATSRFLIDGFPRNTDNLAGWNDKMAASTVVSFVLFLNCDENTMLNRLLQRAQTSGRKDDNIDSIKSRFQTYSASTMPIINHFRELGLVLIDAGGH